jgi:hypothetical protein
MSGLAYNAKPSGRGCQSAHDKCEQKLKKLQRLIDEGYKITHTEVRKPANTAEFKLFGTLTVEVPIEILIKAGFRK